MSNKKIINQYSFVDSYRKLLVRYMGSQKKLAGLMALFIVGSISAQLVSPQVIRYFLDTAQSGGAVAKLISAALIFIGFAILQQAFDLVASYTSQIVAWKAANHLRSDLTLHCLKLDMGFHKRHTPGELIERIDGDVSGLSNFFSQLVVSLLSNGLLVFGILVLLFVEDYRIGIGMSIYTVLTLLALGGLQSLATNRWASARQAIAEQNGYIEERITGVEDIQVSGAEEYTLNRLYGYLRSTLFKLRAAFVVTQLGFNLTRLIYVFGFALGLGLGVFLYRQGQATLGAAYLTIYYIGMLSEPLQNIRRQVQDLQQASASIQRVEELLATKPSVVDGQVHPIDGIRNTISDGPASISFDNVSFLYDDETTENENANNKQLVLSDVSFELAPGKVLGVLGRTGSGKTTLTRLLFRLYDPTSGSIYIDGKDLCDLGLSEIRRRVGLVTQDVQLFEASVRDNLTFFDQTISNQKIEQVLGNLGLWEWVRGLPKGLETRLGSGGKGLSAGEAQLLAFARVFLKDPGVVVLDEASSRLDPLTETRMERAIDNLFNNRTGIIIAHRLRTVERADAILILENGKIIEYGSRLDLSTNPASRYSELLKTGLEEMIA